MRDAHGNSNSYAHSAAAESNGDGNSHPNCHAGSYADTI
jgi:hypothetical protein